MSTQSAPRRSGSGKVWQVDITFRKTVHVYVEADTVSDARKIADRAAEDMEVLEAVGTDYDGWEIQVAQFPRELRVVAAERPDDYVWRLESDCSWALCDSAADRAEEVAQ